MHALLRALTLANAKVSARSVHCVHEDPSEEIYDKSTQGTLTSTFIGSQRCRRFYTVFRKKHPLTFSFISP